MSLRVGERCGAMHVHRLELREAFMVQNIAHEDAEDRGCHWDIRGRAAGVYRVRDYPLAWVWMGRLYFGSACRHWVLVRGMLLVLRDI